MPAPYSSQPDFFLIKKPMEIKTSLLPAGKSAQASAPEDKAPAGLILGQDGRSRCFWAGHDPLYQHYHDTEWGLPTADDRRIFEKLCLEGFQAGLSWITILRKREAFRAAFAGFDFYHLAACDEKALIEDLMQNSGIIRHKGKLAAVFGNARATIKLVEEYGSFTAYLRQFLPPAAERCKLARLADYQTISATALSAKLAKDLKKRGFRFIGPTIAYAFMQAMGMVNDHIAGCCCHAKAEAAQKAFYADCPG